MSQLFRLYRPDASRVTVLESHAARNPKLSRRAKGLLYELGSLPADGRWKIRHKWLLDQATDGKHKLQTAVNELREHGYLQVYRFREGGRFEEALWIVTDNPDERPLPHPDNRDAVERLKDRITSEDPPHPDYPMQAEPDAAEPDADNPTCSGPDVSGPEDSEPDSRRADDGEYGPLRQLADTEPDENGRVTQALVAAWVSLQADRPSEAEISKQGAVAKRLATSHPPRRLALGLYGMERLFPYSEGEPWDLFDFERKLSKAAQAGADAAQGGPTRKDRQEHRKYRETLEAIGDQP